MKTARAIGSVLFLLTFVANGAELEQKTLKAWNEYVDAEKDRMQDRLRPGSQFLWLDEVPNRRARVHSGEILVEPVVAHRPKRVPSGLIHDWIGAYFVPNATLDEVMAAVRDYNRYKDVYRPSVVDSETLERGGSNDRYSLVLMNKAVFLKAALHGVFESSYFLVDGRRAYSVGRTIRMQEIQGYGGAEEHKIPENQGTGFIWRLASISRFEEADGGVYIELEALALSRDIPVSVRWLVDPIVRRVSRDSLTTSLRQAGNAAHSSGELALSTEHRATGQHGR